MEQDVEGMPPYVDVHTHNGNKKGIYILDISDGKEAREWEMCSAGVHPLFIEGMEQLEKVREYAEEGKLTAIGEAGFDRNSRTGMSVQTAVFEEQVRVSEVCRLPLIIHCVRAYPELLAVYKKMHPLQAWIVHGYNNNAQILSELLKHDFYISVGKKVFVENSNIRRLLPVLPDDRIFLETDDSDTTIEEIYRTAAAVKNRPLEILRKEVWNNFERVFGKYSGGKEGI